MIVATQENLSIGEVAFRTGLTERAMRLYEAKGLLAPPRSAAGRREYGPQELSRLHQIRVLRRSGFALARISELFNTREADPCQLMKTQIENLRAKIAALSVALGALESAQEVLVAIRPVDAETLCEVIQLGEQKMKDEAWREVYNNHYTPEEQQRWMDAKGRMGGPGFDKVAYTASWRDLVARVESALPLAPDCEQAQQFLAEWMALLRPFADVLEEDMLEGAEGFWEKLDEYNERQLDPLFSKRVSEFIQAASKAGNPS